MDESSIDALRILATNERIRNIMLVCQIRTKNPPHQELTYSGLFESRPGNELEFLLYFNFAIVSPQYPCS